MMSEKPSNQEIKDDMNEVIKRLEAKGIKHNTKEGEIAGLGDAVESALKGVGITEDRFKSWFALKECNCSKRKKWLNNLFSWKKDK